LIFETVPTDGKTVAQMPSEAAATVPSMSLGELNARLEAGKDDLIVVDVRERDSFEEGHLGFYGAVALDGGMKAWREAGYP
jgi:rhodanese-related sulfurtransferase